MKKICVVTGSRAEYGLLYWLMKDIIDDKDFELQIVVTGMHLSPQFGNTYQEIEKDGFKINKKVDIQLSSDNEVAISKSMGIGMIGFADAFNDLQSDLIIILGDRFEIFSAAAAALIAKIPVAHIHGGEKTEGSFDDSLRHSITKMSHLHFTAIEEYKNRVIQLGEEPKRVFNVGGLGIDNINKLKLLSKADLENKINFKLGKKNILITFHPATLEKVKSETQFQQLLDSITELKNTKIIFTKSNSDPGGNAINKIIDEYASKNSNTAVFKSMGQLKYLSALQFVDAVVGNSSSGLLEAPSFNIGTIDIGDRQKGRIKSKSVINCLPIKNNIDNAFKKLYSDDFKKIINISKNPYGDGGASQRIIKIIKTTDLNNILKKPFFDITIK
jgi:GDP/UDP-N,N'-diacetylbacillosamine 2-epimerase (hydrolysing)